MVCILSPLAPDQLNFSISTLLTLVCKSVESFNMWIQRSSTPNTPYSCSIWRLLCCPVIINELLCNEINLRTTGYTVPQSYDLSCSWIAYDLTRSHASSLRLISCTPVNLRLVMHSSQPRIHHMRSCKQNKEAQNTANATFKSSVHRSLQINPINPRCWTLYSQRSLCKRRSVIGWRYIPQQLYTISRVALTFLSFSSSLQKLRPSPLGFLIVFTVHHLQLCG